MGEMQGQGSLVLGPGLLANSLGDTPATQTSKVFSTGQRLEEILTVVSQPQTSLPLPCRVHTLQVFYLRPSPQPTVCPGPDSHYLTCASHKYHCGRLRCCEAWRRDRRGGQVYVVVLQGRR